MHHPVLSAGLHGDLRSLQGVFGELEGHASSPSPVMTTTCSGSARSGGITPYVDGAGGRDLYPVNRDDPRLAFADDTHHGALRIKLRPGRAVLTFVAEDGTPLDRSAVDCRQR